MRVLFLDDDVGTRQYFSGLLIDRNYEVEQFGRIDQAKEYFFSHYNEIDCLLIDLNMSDEWLGEYQVEAEGGRLSGWIFIKRFIYPIRRRIPTVIYSGFEDYFEKIRYEATDNAIELLAKRKFSDGRIDSIVNAIERVVKKGASI